MEHEGRECPSCLVRNEAVACRDPWSRGLQVEVDFQLVSSLCLWSPHVHGQKEVHFNMFCPFIVDEIVGYEELIMYLSATYGAISSVLMTERGTAQMPIYFISRALQGLKLNNSPMEKLVLSLIFTAKRLQRYFQAHPIVVVTDQPIKQLMSRPDVAGRLQKRRLASGASSSDSRRTIDAFHRWFVVCGWVRCMAYTDKPRGNRVYLRTKVPVHGLQQRRREDNMIKYLEIVKGLVSGFTTFLIRQVPRSKNKKADALSKIASTSFAHLSKQVLVEVLENKSIKGNEVTAVIEEEGPTWMTQLVDYLKEGILPGDEKEARKIRLKARQYEFIEGVLYRCSFLTPWLRYVGPLQADYVMREIHEGSYSMHAGSQSVVAKDMRLGYYWPTMHKDAHDMIRKCSKSDTPPCHKASPVVSDLNHGSIEVKAVATITGGQVKKFAWDNIVCRFGIQSEIISDNVIPIEIRMPTYRTASVDVVNNNEELRLNLDLLGERWERATVYKARAKSKMKKYYNARVHDVTFKPSDFVYRNNDASHAIAGGKLGPK
nr:reverse transcriptase domain-containing protein [Tanacetum cinerariifolium]